MNSSANTEDRNNIVNNGSFEDGVDVGQGHVSELAPGSGSIAGWRIGGRGVDYVGSGWWQSSDSLARSIDLSAATPGSVSQVISTEPSAYYDVIFALAGNPKGGPETKMMTVSATGNNPTTYSFNAAGKTARDMGWVDNRYRFYAKSDSTTLTFASVTDGNSGPALDNVRVFECESWPRPNYDSGVAPDSGMTTATLIVPANTMAFVSVTASSTIAQEIEIWVEAVPSSSIEFEKTYATTQGSLHEHLGNHVFPEVNYDRKFSFRFSHNYIEEYSNYNHGSTLKEFYIVDNDPGGGMNFRYITAKDCSGAPVDFPGASVFIYWANGCTFER